ncbi:MAG: SPFH domain-containing protein [Pseudomonadota bacterium]
MEIVMWIISAVVLLGLVWAFLGSIFVIVPQGYVVLIERFGKYNRQMNSGLNLKIPLIESAEKINIMEQFIDLSPKQRVICKDNVHVEVDGILYYIITDAAKSSYGVANLVQALTNFAMSTLRSTIGTMDLDHVLSNRADINSTLLASVNEAAAQWGVNVTRVEIKDLDPPVDVTQAMEKQMKAERERRAAVTQAEGEKQAAVLKAEGLKLAKIAQAEGELEAAKLAAEARERTAEAEAKAIEVVNKAIATGNEQTIAYFLGLKQYEALAEFAKNQGKGTIVVPANLGALAGDVTSILSILSNKTTA